jgi:hypothetical protein
MELVAASITGSPGVPPPVLLPELLPELLLELPLELLLPDEAQESLPEVKTTAMQTSA